MTFQSTVKKISLGSAIAISSITGCNTSQPQTPAEIAQAYKQSANAPDPENMYNILKAVEFTDQDGEKIILNALKTKIGTNFATLTFGFGSCKGLCPTINGNLANIGKDHPNAVSIFVCCDSKIDEINSIKNQKEKTDELKKLRSEYVQSIRARGVKQEIIVLFPESAAKANLVARETGAITNDANPTAHSGNILLYAPGGKKVAEVFGMSEYSEVEKTFGKYLSGSEIKK